MIITLFKQAEASYPYQIAGDLLGIAAGRPHRLYVFPRDPSGEELSPGRKIVDLHALAKDTGLRASVKPLRESWNAQLRNAIFHSNYAIIGDQIRLVGVGNTELQPVSSILARVNRAVAAFEALNRIQTYHRQKYKSPVNIDAPEYFAHEVGTQSTVVVREGYGAVAIHDTVKDFGTESPVILGRVTREELRLINDGQFLLPARSH